MTSLNKIAKVLVVSGLSCWVSVAQANTIQINQDAQVNQNTQLSQGVDSTDNSAQMSTHSDSSATSNTQVTANNADNNPQASDPSEPAQSEPTEQQVSNGVSGTNAKAFDSNNQMVATLTNNTGSTVNITAGVAATLSQSLNQVSTTELPESDIPQESETTPDEDLAESEEVVRASNLGSQTTFANTSQLSQSLSQGMFKNMSGGLQNANALDSATSLIGSSQLSQSLSGDLQNIAAADAAAQTTQVLEQSINANIVNSITSDTQSVITQDVNNQISRVVTEQVNAEIAAATAAEVVSTLASDLAIGL
ncbi:hypothetical protein [Colwellia sp. BRX10-4]|jgi:hypothetical protein|uniref:hypothetical protein n=1 Tax=Colwellia sp. BRX10-4 TaxID=2759843 RepID=UPI0015F35DBC|nr:hypothetical protein [Colwellia sp. BRX10-4]MBA6398321.1 hypothetical protein [Colwellia sp. BRX10-4]